MLSNRTLERTIGLRPQSVALWGDLIRAISTAIVTLVVIGLTLVYAQTLRNTVVIRSLQDFGVFYDSAARARAGADLYSSGLPADTPQPRRNANLNPPHFHLLLWPFTALAPSTAFTAWMAVSAASLIASLVLVAQALHLRGWSAVSLFALAYASPAMFATTMTGQVGMVLLLPFTVAWRQARERHHVTSAAWLGLCASAKAPFLLSIPYFARIGLWRAALVQALVVALAFAVGVALFGVGAHRDWANNLMSVTWAEHYMNASLLGLVERALSASEWQQHPLTDAPWLVTPMLLAAAGIVGAATLWRVRSITSVDRQFLLVTTAALLISPLSWLYYLWFLIPPLSAHLVSLSVFDRGTRGMLTVVALTGLLTPPPLAWAALSWGAGVGTLTLGSVYCWALIALWLVALRGAGRGVMRTPRRAPRAAEMPARGRGSSRAPRLRSAATAHAVD